MTDTEPTPEELRAIAAGEVNTGANERCPFCGTTKLVTRLGDHLLDRHREELYRAIAMYKE